MDILFSLLPHVNNGISTGHIPINLGEKKHIYYIYIIYT